MSVKKARSPVVEVRPRGPADGGAGLNGAAGAGERAAGQGPSFPPRGALEAGKCIRVRGAREHNLKSVDIDIPRDKLVVITGLSGSGKSSLAFDTIFAEGQRKYMESLSAYARQFLDQLKKPDVDDIEGLPPTIAIEQRSGVANPRSTVATTTEIYDYLRLLYARCGRPRCWHPTKVKKDGTVLSRCGLEIKATGATQIIDALLAGPARRAMVLAPVVRQKKGFHRDVLEEQQSRGWGRVRVNGALIEIREALKDVGENPLKLGRYEKHDIEVVVDRLMIEQDAGGGRQRLAESIESGLKVGGGTVIVAEESAAAPGTFIDRVFSDRFACAAHPACALEELSPRLFSFNSPQGACPECHGLGTIMEFDEALVIPDRGKSLSEGAIKPWKVPPPMGRVYRKKIRQFCQDFGVSPSEPVDDLPAWAVKILLRGTDAVSQAEHGAKFDGVYPGLREWYQRTESSFVREWLGQYMHEAVCPACRGDRLRIESLHVLLGSGHAGEARRAFTGAVIGRGEGADGGGGGSRADGRSLNIAELSRLTITDAAGYLGELELGPEQRVIAEPIVKEVLARLGFLRSVGLEYLSLDRKTGTLSGGEAQRIRLATQVGSKLVGACYVLDEPTIGLHQRDNARLIATLRRLADIGNSVLVVEHDEDMIRAADWVVDMGPGPGTHGGTMVAQGRVEDLEALGHRLGEAGNQAADQRGAARFQPPAGVSAGDPGVKQSLTALYLAGRRAIATPQTRRPLNDKAAVVVKGASENNLKRIDAAFPIGGERGGVVCVTGVSGSGKSTLVNDILLRALKRVLMESKERPGAHAGLSGTTRIHRVIEVDQSPIGRTPRSNAATYTGMFDDIRRLFAQTKEAKIRGYEPGRFSFNVRARSGGGRCEACEGQGLKKIEMHFLPDVYVNCEVCRGLRYNRETLEVLYRGKSIADVLGLTVEQACEFFSNHPKIFRFVRCLHEVGLDYVQLGQPSTTLSGGEAQRVKLATELGKTARGWANEEDLPPAPLPAALAARRVKDEDDDPGEEVREGSDDAVQPAVMKRGAGRPPALSGAGGVYPKTLYILDEPTTGLHFEDVRRLIAVFNRLADAGNTLVVIEHNLDVIKCADWIIDLGPEGGDGGGTIVAAGTPEAVMREPRSYTGVYLKQHLEMERRRSTAVA